MTDFWQGMFPAILKKSEFEFTFLINHNIIMYTIYPVHSRKPNQQTE